MHKYRIIRLMPIVFFLFLLLFLLWTEQPRAAESVSPGSGDSSAIRLSPDSWKIATSAKTHRIAGSAVSLSGGRKPVVKIGGKAVPLAAEKTGRWGFSHTVNLSSGSNIFTISLHDSDGAVIEEEILTVEKIPETLAVTINIEPPNEGLNTREPNNVYKIKGKINGGHAPWTLSSGGRSVSARPDGSFILPVKVKPVEDIISLTIHDGKGKKVNYDIKVTGDVHELGMFISSPRQSAETTEEVFPVRGFVKGGWGEIRIRVNDREILTYSNNDFEALVPLREGHNRIRISALDELGNTIPPRELVMTKIMPKKPQPVAMETPPVETRSEPAGIPQAPPAPEPQQIAEAVPVKQTESLTPPTGTERRDIVVDQKAATAAPAPEKRQEPTIPQPAPAPVSPRATETTPGRLHASVQQHSPGTDSLIPPSPPQAALPPIKQPPSQLQPVAPPSMASVPAKDLPQTQTPPRVAEPAPSLQASPPKTPVTAPAFPSVAEPVPVTAKKTVPSRDEPFIIKPKLYILGIGVSTYQDPEYNLVYSAKDARDFVGIMSRQKGGLYRDVEVRLLTDAQATKDAILESLEWIQRQTTDKDLAMLFLSGHGINDPWGIYYYVPYNFEKLSIKKTAVPFTDIRNTLASLSGKAILFVDTCHAGNVMGGGRGSHDMSQALKELMSAEKGVIVFASSSGRQVSWERDEWGNGAFTLALIEGLKGKADYTGNRVISVNKLDLYLSERVKELTKGQQTPTTTKPQSIQDFPLAIVD